MTELRTNEHDKHDEQNNGAGGTSSSAARTARRIVRGYTVLGLRLLHIIALVGGAILVAFAIVVPLWLAATRATEAYTVAVIVIIAVALIGAVVRRIRDQGTGTVIPILKVAGRILGVLAGIYAMVFLFARGYTAAAAFIAVAGLVWLGYAAAGNRSTQNGNETS